MSACLNENLTSHAFDGILDYTDNIREITFCLHIGYEVIWEELYDSVQCVYTLTDPAIDQVWNVFIQCGSILSLFNSYSAPMYRGVQVEQCLLLRILYYLKFNSIHFLTLLITAMVDTIMRIGAPTRYVRAYSCVVRV